MPNLVSLVDALGGMAQKQQLVTRGARDRDLTAAVKSGEVTRVRNGWYSTLDQGDPGLRAVRVGGRLTGISLVQAMGGWVLDRHPLHVSVARNAARLRTQTNRRSRLDPRSPRGVRLHWEDTAVESRGTATSVELVDALALVVLHESLETAVAAFDWALHTGHLEWFDVEALFLRLPAALRWVIDWIDGACESLPESLSRTRFRVAGHDLRIQVPLGDLERIDIVVDESAAIEVDGEEHHLARFEQDRAKDIRITLAGYHALRPSARTVFHDWESFLDAVHVALVARGVTLPVSLFAHGETGPRCPRIRPRRHAGAHRRARALEIPRVG